MQLASACRRGGGRFATIPGEIDPYLRLWLLQLRIDWRSIGIKAAMISSD